MEEVRRKGEGNGGTVKEKGKGIQGRKKGRKGEREKGAKRKGEQGKKRKKEINDKDNKKRKGKMKGME